MRNQHLIASLAAVGLAPLLASATTSIHLTFDGSGNTVADTGFEQAYTPDPTGFSVGGGKLTLTTLPGDTYGNYENDPDTAKNQFFTHLDPLGRTVVETHVNIQNLNVNFHGGGIWLGTDQDHYFRLGIINNTFEGGISGEGIRENEDRWGNAVPPGPGDDIVNRQLPNLGTSPQFTPIDATLRIIRNGNNVCGYISTNGGSFSQVGGAGFVYGGLATSPADPQGGGSNTVEDTFKSGLYAFGGPDGSIPATFAFDDFAADSYYLGDFNNDHQVDITDLAILATNWQSTNGTWETGDANEDGTVDITDLAALATNWQAGTSAPSIQFAEAAAGLGLPSPVVPEPSVAVLPLALGIGCRRRRN